jgi:hypothetical protein
MRAGGLRRFDPATALAGDAIILSSFDTIVATIAMWMGAEWGLAARGLPYDERIIPYELRARPTLGPWLVPG